MGFHLTGMEFQTNMSKRMPTVDTTKKPALGDWHRADIKAALEKAGWSFRRLATLHGYSAKSLSAVLWKPWPRAEKLVAEALGVPAQRIWPSRYRKDGTPKSDRGERGLGRYKKKNSTAVSASNAYPRGRA